jgi:DNA-binding NtrC family response regulator
MKKVLITDDQIDLGQVLADAITENYEATVDVTLSGTNAILKLNENNYDILITDLRMLDMNGIALIKLINQGVVKHKPKHIWIISGFINDEQKDLLINNNITVFQKPIDYKLFHEKLAQHLTTKN